MHATWLPLSIISALCYTAFKAGARGGGNRFGATMWTLAFRWTPLDAFEDHVFFGKSALDFRGVVWLHLAGL